MVRHVIIWQLKDGLSAAERQRAKEEIKAGLEALKGVVPGLEDIAVHTEGLASSSGDLLLDSTFTDEAALKGYVVHPEHVKVADGVVRPRTKLRVCMDYEL